jgi:peptidoglycan/LPS O-acetylase OafA/YrhL
MSGYRRLYLAETIIFTAIMFAGPSLVRDERTGEIIFDVAEIIISWTCSVAAAGYARKYLSFDSPFRKSANEAIYPFYLLHQPLIVVTGYFVTSLQVADIIKALIIILQSLILFILIYNSLIRPFNSMRVIFGMKISRVDSTLPLNMTRPSGEGSDERRA